MFTISPAIAWLIAALAALGLEIFLATAFLLAVAFGFAAAAVAAAFDCTFTWQLVICAAALGLGSVSILYYRRAAARRGDPSAELQNLDAGQWVTVETVSADGLATVQYRGAPWTARPEGDKPLTPGRWTIARVDGTQLVLGRRL